MDVRVRLMILFIMRIRIEPLLFVVTHVHTCRTNKNDVFASSNVFGSATTGSATERRPLGADGVKGLARGPQQWLWSGESGIEPQLYTLPDNHAQSLATLVHTVARLHRGFEPRTF